MPSQTVDFLFTSAAALAGKYVTLVSNVDGVTAYPAITTSDVNGKWTISPKPPAGTYALYSGAAQGALTTLVDPDYVVDPFNDDGTAVFPKQVTISAGGLVVTAGGINVTAGGITVAAGGVAVTGNSTLAGSLTITGSPNTFRADGLGSDEQVRVSATAGFNRMIDFQTAGTPRWRLIGADNVAEAGANAGSNFILEARDDAGVSLGNAISIARATRVVTIVNGLVVGAGGVTVVGSTSFFTTGGNGLSIAQESGTIHQIGAVGTTTILHLFNLSLEVDGTIDTHNAGQLQIGPAGGHASSLAIRSPAKAIINGTTLQAFGAGAQTMTAAQMLGGVIEGVPTVGSAYTFDTGANLDGAVPNVATGDTFVFVVSNRAAGAFNITLTAAAGITILGNGVIPQSKVAVITMRRTGANAWSAYSAVSQ